MIKPGTIEHILHNICIIFFENSHKNNRNTFILIDFFSKFVIIKNKWRYMTHYCSRLFHGMIVIRRFLGHHTCEGSKQSCKWNGSRSIEKLVRWFKSEDRTVILLRCISVISEISTFSMRQPDLFYFSVMLSSFLLLLVLQQTSRLWCCRPSLT